MIDPDHQCRVEGCPRRAARRLRNHEQNLCTVHAQRLRRTGSVMADKPIIEKRRGGNLNADGTRKVCHLTGCGRPASSRGFCHAHWKRVRRNDGIPYGHVPVGALTEYRAEMRARKLLEKGA